jgi:hypothetical protein
MAVFCTIKQGIVSGSRKVEQLYENFEIPQKVPNITGIFVRQLAVLE